jgi:tetratricopeptide (TPR) repeat protein
LYLRETEQAALAFDVLKGLLDATPQDEEALGLMMELAGMEDFKVEALKVIARVHEALQDWGSLTRDGLDMVELMDGTPELGEDVLGLVNALRQAERYDEASEVLISMLRRPGFDESLVRMAGDTLYEAGRLNDMALLLNGIAVDMDDDDYAAFLRKAGAKFLMDKNALKGARDLLRRHVEETPDDQDSIATLKDLYAGLNDPEGLVFTIGLMAELEEDPEAKKVLLLEGGELARDQLEDMSLAETYFLRVFEVEEDSWEAFAALETLYRTKGDDEALYNLHHREFNALKGKGGENWKEVGLVLIQEALDREDLDTAGEVAVALLESGEKGTECVAAAKEVLFRKKGDPFFLGL